LLARSGYAVSSRSRISRLRTPMSSTSLAVAVGVEDVAGAGSSRIKDRDDLPNMLTKNSSSTDSLMRTACMADRPAYRVGRSDSRVGVEVAARGSAAARAGAREPHRR
jgi:hypothetical protein